jgi:acylphosphatase
MAKLEIQDGELVEQAYIDLLLKIKRLICGGSASLCSRNMKSSLHRGQRDGSVGLRYFVLHLAIQLGVTGWVRNLPIGVVEIEAEGNRELVESLIVYARRGPRSAVVSSAAVEWKEHRRQFESFEIAD